jgi:hypothetical protein
MGLTKKTIEYLNMAAGGSFMHVSVKKGRSILTKILADLLEKREKLLKEESQLAKPESLPEPSPTSVFQIPNHRKRRKLQF